MSRQPNHEIGSAISALPVYDDGLTEDGIDPKGPMRRCIATGEVLDKDRLIRFGISPEGVVVPDIAERLPGRGLWVTADKSALDTAIAKNAFSRAARRNTKVPPDLAEQVAKLLRCRLVDMIGIARRAGVAIAGFDKVETAASRRKLAAVLVGSDSGKDGRRKLEALAPSAYFIDVLDSKTLAGIFGAIGIVVYAGISDKAHAQRLAGLARKLAALEPEVCSGDVHGHDASKGMIGQDERQ
jgi:predicted RNA-binding protein YlxR (DUF448 family)